MGLDMYLNKMPRYGNATPTDVISIEDYIDYLDSVKDPDSSAKEYTMEEWCGIKESDVPMDMIEFYSQFFTKRYSAWDTDHMYGYDRIIEQVAYWRKANAIHRWFVEHVQDGEDDCSYHNEVTKEVLEDLLYDCNLVLNHSKLVKGKVLNGWTYKDGRKIPTYEDGEYIEDPSVAMEVLPTESGFFFGSTDYDQWYYEDIKYTTETIRTILDTTDFEKEMIYYISSW